MRTYTVYIYTKLIFNTLCKKESWISVFKKRMFEKRVRGAGASAGTNLRYYGTYLANLEMFIFFHKIQILIFYFSHNYPSCCSIYFYFCLPFKANLVLASHKTISTGTWGDSWRMGSANSRIRSMCSLPKFYCKPQANILIKSDDGSWTSNVKMA